MTKPNISVIFLAGGTGSRTGLSYPKQFFLLNDKPLFQYSLDLFDSLPNIIEIIIVTEEAFRDRFKGAYQFALPGSERQFSVFNGFQKVSQSAEYVLIHDSARPFLQKNDLVKVIQEAQIYGAAALAIPLNATVKACSLDHMVLKTIPRETLFEIQTPQVIKKEWLEQGFEYCSKHNVKVTDDLSLIEYLGYPAKLTMGSASNLKITTDFDLKFAQFCFYEKL